MRLLLLTSLSAALLSGCLTTQENPNYEYSSRYNGDTPQVNQYATAQPAETTAATYTTSASTGAYTATAPQPAYDTQHSVQQTSTQQYATQQATTQFPLIHHSLAPTDSSYGTREVTGTPGYMAMQASQQANLAPALPAAQMVASAPMAAAGTPVAYDYSRNLVVADVATSGPQIADTVRVYPQSTSGMSYIVQPGDTVYSLSRRTCVGVQVIKSLNGLDANYGINIGQTLTLPTSVC